jgi:protein ImuB
VARADGSSAVIEAGLSAPSRAPAHLFCLFKERIEALDLGFGVDFMSLAALVTEALPPAQTDLAEESGKARPETLIDRLINRLGSRAVRRLVPRASHLPELAQGLKSAFAGPSPWPEPLWRKPQRPPLLFTTPEPLTVLAEIPEGPPARFTWRRVTRRVIKSEGPERIAPEWWRSLVRTAESDSERDIPPSDAQSAPISPPRGGLEPVTPTANTARPRDYYRIEDEDGHRYWVFREGLYQEAGLGPPSWYLHGVFG